MNKLPTRQCNIRIAGINATTRRPFLRKVVCNLLPHLSKEPIMETEFLVMPGESINRLPNEEFSMEFVAPDDIAR